MIKSQTKLLLRSLCIFAFAGVICAQTYRISSFAGTPAIGDNGNASAALLKFPNSVLADSRGGYYISDLGHYRIRYVDASGRITTIAGLGYQTAPINGVPATLTGILSAIELKLSRDGELHFVDYISCRVMKIDKDSILRFVAGSGICGFNGDGALALSTQLNNPGGITFDAQGLLVIADTNNSRLRRVNANGTVQTIAGNGQTAFSRENAAALTSTVLFPQALTAAPDGTIYIAESGYRRIRRLTPGGFVFTAAGDGFDGNSGDGGLASAARFGRIGGIALDSSRNFLYISDANNHRVRAVILNSNIITAFAGSAPQNSASPVTPAFAGDNGAPVLARFNSPFGLSYDSSPFVLIADQANDRIRRVDTVIRTVAGRFRNVADSGPALEAELNEPRTIIPSTNGDTLLLDSANRVIRRVTSAGLMSIVAGQPPSRLPSLVSSGDGGPATAASFSNLSSMTVDATGRIYVIDNGVLRRIEAGQITTAGITLPTGGSIILADPPRNRLFVSISTSNKIQVADLAQTPITFRDFAGTGVAGYAGDEQLANAAQINFPRRMAVDRSGILYFVDAANYVIRRVGVDGRIATVAGTGRAPSAIAVVEGPALQVPINAVGLALDPTGNFLAYSQDDATPYIRQINLTTATIRRIAGNGNPGLTGDGGLALNAQLTLPGDMAYDANGNLYFTEIHNNVVRVLRPLLATRLESVSGDNQSAPVATRLSNPIVLRVLNGEAPASGVAVSFRATGSAAITPASATTDATGQARAELTLGPNPGPITITASVDGLPEITFRATATTAVVNNPNRPSIGASGSIVTASAFGGRTSISPATWIEIYGTNLATTTRPWGDADFRGPQAPSELDGVKVTINGRSAFVAFISPGQINAQVPDGIGIGPVPVIVTNANGTSDQITITAVTASPGLLAPSSFLIGGVQYVVALHQDGAFVGSEGLIPGANFRPSKPGDVLTLYGVGFGTTTPPRASGQVVSGLANLADLKLFLGDQEASVQFAGLAPGAIGLYQFNFIVPNGVRGNLPLRLRLNGAPIDQPLTLTTINE